MKFIGICGSLRKASINRALLNALAKSTPAGSTLEVADIGGLPLYNGDVEEAAFPSAVTDLKERLAAADGLVICSPEYNGSLPAAGKNAIDWLSRPPQDQARVIRGKPVALAGASPSRTGTSMVQTHWLLVFRALGMPTYPGFLMLPSAHELFDAQGQLKDEATQKRLLPFMQGFVEFAQRFAR